MANSTGAINRRRERDKARAAAMKRDGIERTTGRCAVCYRIVVVDSSRTRNTHIGKC